MNIHPKAGAAKRAKIPSEDEYNEILAYVVDNFKWWAGMSLTEREKFIREWFEERGYDRLDNE